MLWMHFRHAPLSRSQLPTALGSMLSLHLQLRHARTGPLWPRGSPKKPSSQSSQRFPGRAETRVRTGSWAEAGATAGTHLWFLPDSWCTPPPCSSGPPRRWPRRGRGRAGSRPPSRHWRRRRNRLCSAHSSSRLCCPGSHTLLDREGRSSQPAGGRGGGGGAGRPGPVSGSQDSLWPLQLQGSQALKAPSSGRARRYPSVQRSHCCPW